MQNVILLVSTSAIFIFVYFLMNKLDVFLENNWNRQETALTYGENSLRIGFSNPLMAGGLADAFETYGKQHPDVSIHIFSGEESELCRELGADYPESNHTNSTMEGFPKITCRRVFHWMPEQLCRGSVADVGFDVVCYNIEKGNRFYLSDR